MTRPYSARRERYLIAALVLALIAGLAVDAANKMKPRPTVTLKSFPEPEGGPYGEEMPRATAPRRIDINTAPLEELMRLKGVGKVTAQRIIDHRSSHGPFSSTEELANVRGVSRKIFLDNKDSLIVGESE